MKFPLKDKQVLKDVYTFAKKKKVKLYLVGGILRDLLLGREKDNPDFDFCLKRQAINFGRQLSKEIKTGFVVLDKEHGACRLVKNMRGNTYTLDFTDFRGRTLEEDLLHRDFTINTLALELEKVFCRIDPDKELIDPYRGRQDLAGGLIRVVNKKAFLEDPLRVLRAFTFSCVLGFGIDGASLRLAQAASRRLSNVSFERIREELFKILDTQNSFDFMVQLDKAKIMEVIFPEIKKMRGIGQGPYHHLDVWQHTLETLKQFELLIKEFRNNQDIKDYLNEIVSAQRRRYSLIKLAALLHDVGKPAALRYKEGKTIFHGHERIGLEISEIIAKRLKLSNDEVNSLRKMVLWHLRPGYLADNDILTSRAVFRYFRDADKEAVGILLLSLADQRATKGPLTTALSRTRHEKVCKGLIKNYFKKNKEEKIPRLLNGDILIKEFNLTPSPLIGKILSELDELQAIGKIKTKGEALKISSLLIKNSKQKTAN